MRVMILGVFLCLVGCTGNGGSPDSGGDGSTVCTTDVDCGAGKTCQGGVCADAAGCEVSGCKDHYLCDTQTGLCVGSAEKSCVLDTDCGDWKCNGVSGRCTEPCIVDTDCDLDKKCNNAIAGCVDCTFDTHCPGTEAPYCDADKGLCVQCTEAGHCSESQHCDLSGANPDTANTCLDGCLDGNDCPANKRCVRLTAGPGDCRSCTVETQVQDCLDPGRPFCHPQTLECVQCVIDDGCPTDFVCSAEGVCVDCKDDTQCTMGFVCNTAINECIAGCRDDSKCPPPDNLPRTLCDPTKGQIGTCEECLSDADCGLGKKCSDGDCIDGCNDDTNCPTATPKCNVTQDRCVECLATSDCASGLKCELGGDPVDRFKCRCLATGELCTASTECGDYFGGICQGGYCGNGVSCADNGTFKNFSSTCLNIADLGCGIQGSSSGCPANHTCERVRNVEGTIGLRCLDNSVCGR